MTSTNLMPSFNVNTKLLWKAFSDGQIQEETKNLDFAGTYQQFYQYLRETSKHQQQTDSVANIDIKLDRGVLITDLAPRSTYIKGAPINFYDAEFDTKTLKLTQVNSNKQSLQDTINTLTTESYSITPISNPRDYYKEVLALYDRVTFFDQFNTFKYVISKELRTDLEEAVYKYFSSLIDIAIFRERFLSIESKLKANQVERFEPVKTFILSERAEVLLRLVTEKDQEVIKTSLDEFALDYFDVNYLKAYLRDYGKTKEEKAKKKVRVQELSLEEEDMPNSLVE